MARRRTPAITTHPTMDCDSLNGARSRETLEPRYLLLNPPDRPTLPGAIGLAVCAAYGS